MATRLVTVNDILAGHVTLDVSCLDRIYLNGYLPTVQVPGQVVQFLARRGFPIPSPAVVEKMGTRFRDAVRAFAQANHIPVVRFTKNDRKIAVMQPYVQRQAATGRSGWPRSEWRRSSSGCSPPPPARSVRRLGCRTSPGRRPTAG